MDKKIHQAPTARTSRPGAARPICGWSGGRERSAQGVSNVGQTWTYRPAPFDVDLPSIVHVGVDAVNTSKPPFTVEFEELKWTSNSSERPGESPPDDKWGTAPPCPSPDATNRPAYDGREGGASGWPDREGVGCSRRGARSPTPAVGESQTGSCSGAWTTPLHWVQRNFLPADPFGSLYSVPHAGQAMVTPPPGRADSAAARPWAGRQSNRTTPTGSPCP